MADAIRVVAVAPGHLALASGLRKAIQVLRIENGVFVV